MSRTVGLALPDTVTGVGAQTFEVTVTLRPTDSSRNFEAGLIVIGAETNRHYGLGVDSVVVTLGGGDQALNAVDAASFAASINVSGLGAGAHEVDVRVVPPPGLTLLAVSPPRVTVFVGEAATPPPTPTPTLVPTLEPSVQPSTEPASAVPSVSGAAGAGSPTIPLAASASP